MDDDERLLEFLKHCQREYRRRRRNGQWLWVISDDSTDSEPVVESEDP